MKVEYLTVKANDPVFEFLHGNRKVALSKSKDSIKLVGREYLLQSLKEDKQVYPILCLNNIETGTYFVIDGQNRLKALQILDSDVEIKLYTVDRENRTIEEVELEERELVDKLIRATNSTPVKWDKEQHFKWNIEWNQDQNYITFKRLMDTYTGFDVNILYQLVSGRSKSFKKDFETRNLFVKPDLSESLIRDVNDLSTAFLNYRKNSLKLLGSRKAIINEAFIRLLQNHEVDVTSFRFKVASYQIINIDVSSPFNLYSGLLKL